MTVPFIFLSPKVLCRLKHGIPTISTLLTAVIVVVWLLLLLNSGHRIQLPLDINIFTKCELNSDYFRLIIGKHQCLISSHDNIRNRTCYPFLRCYEEEEETDLRCTSWLMRFRENIQIPRIFPVRFMMVLGLYKDMSYTQLITIEPRRLQRLYISTKNKLSGREKLIGSLFSGLRKRATSTETIWNSLQDKTRRLRTVINVLSLYREMALL